MAGQTLCTQMNPDEGQRGRQEAHKLKCPTGPTSTKANLDGEIIQLNPSKHCWRPRQTLAWPTRFTRGPFPTPLPRNFPFPANVYTRSIALSITGTSQLWPLYHFRNTLPRNHYCNSTTSFIGIHANHQLITRTYVCKTVRLYCMRTHAQMGKRSFVYSFIHMRT